MWSTPATSYEKMYKVEVKFIGFEAGTQEVRDIYKRILMRSIFKMEELAIQKAPVDLGFLRQNIYVSPQILSDRYLLISSAPYSLPLEFGSKPYWAPIKPLSDWAKRKLGDPNLGYAIQAKIAREGIRAQPFMRPSLFEVESYWMPEIAREEFSSV